MGIAATTDLLRLLGDASRLRLLNLLAREELTVAELTRITRLSQSRVSTHLGRLKEAGLVRDRRDGAAAFHALHEAGMGETARSFWELVRGSASDPLLEQDVRRLREVLRERQGGRTWADRVAGRMERHYSPGRTWEAALRGLLGMMRLGSVLDIASGDSALAELIAPRARRVACLDSSERLVRAGRQRLARFSHVDFFRGDMHALPFRSASFDHAMLMACLCYAEDPARAVAEAARILKPGGTLVAVALNRHRHRDVVGRYDHVRLGFAPPELKRWAAAAGLEVSLCEVTMRERRAPHFEVIALHAEKAA